MKAPAMARATRIAHATWPPATPPGAVRVLLAHGLEALGGDEVVGGVPAVVGGLPAAVEQ
jgi:hypothetical protein